MGKKIDGAALVALGALTAFFLLYRATGSAFAAGAAAFLLIVSARPVFLKLKARLFAKRRARREERAAFDLALKSPDVRLAQKAIEALLLRAYGASVSGGEDGPRIRAGGKTADFLFLPWRAEGRTLDLNDLWDRGRGKSGAPLVLVTTGRAEPSARRAFAQLRAAETRVLDADDLTKLFASHPAPVECGEKKKEEPPAARRARPREALIRLVSKKRAPRCALWGLVFLGYYLVSGLYAHLIAALFLLAVAALGLRGPAAPENLI